MTSRPALFVGGWALAQLWLFWVAPLLGAALTGFACRWLETEEVVERLPPVSGDLAP